MKLDFGLVVLGVVKKRWIRLEGAGGEVLQRVLRSARQIVQCFPLSNFHLRFAISVLYFPPTLVSRQLD